MSLSSEVKRISGSLGSRRGRCFKEHRRWLHPVLRVGPLAQSLRSSTRVNNAVGLAVVTLRAASKEVGLTPASCGYRREGGRKKQLEVQSTEASFKEFPS